MMSIWDWGSGFVQTQETYFDKIEFIDDQFDAYYHCHDGGYDYHNDSL